MMEIMYEIPSRDDIKKCIVTKETIRNHQLPTLVLYDSKKETSKKELTKGKESVS
jgi:ATP-dependent Clp protease ATP-binding subunit ClpX